MLVGWLFPGHRITYRKTVNLSKPTGHGPLCCESWPEPSHQAQDLGGFVVWERNTYPSVLKDTNLEFQHPLLYYLSMYYSKKQNQHKPGCQLSFSDDPK